MQKDTIIVTDNNVNPIKQICVVKVNTDVDPPTDVLTEIDYNTLSVADKALFDQTIAMIEAHIPV